ncbi:MAG: hypothetical protein H0S80_14240 [Desulfovibrionaceae bacterium]|nr:hypothetical protein [Desulfovibrionaceae bacterium]
MNSLLNMDAFTSTRNNPRTGLTERKWIEYADGVLEPVRRDGNLNRKYHGNKRELDWWTVDKPLDWDPLKESRDVSLNHDYGQRNKPKEKLEKPLGPARPEDAGKHREPMPCRRGEKAEPVLFAAAGGKKEPEEENRAVPDQPESPKTPKDDREGKSTTSKTTLLRGADAYREFEAEQKAAENAKAGENPQPTPGGSGKLAGADATPPQKENHGGNAESGAGAAGAAGGMVKPKGQHGKGPATGNDMRIKQFIEDYKNAKPKDKPKVKENFQNEIKELQKRAKSAKGKAKKNMQRQANHWKGALKVTTDGKVRSGGPLICSGSYLI